MMRIRNILLIAFITLANILIFFTCTNTTENYNYLGPKKPEIPKKVIPFKYDIPYKMITNPEKKEEMIQKKIENLLKTNNVFWGGLPGTEDELLTVFVDISNFITSNFSGFNGLDLDWIGFTDEYYSKMEYAMNYGEFAYIMTKMGFVLQEGHTQIIPSRLMGDEGLNFMLDNAPVLVTQPFTRIGACYTVTQDEELVISKLIEEYDSPYNFKKGDEIVGFNGVPWQDWVDRLIDAGIPIYASPGANEDTIRYNLLKSGMANINLFETVNIKRWETGKIETMDVIYIHPKENLAYCTDLTQAEGLDDWRDDIFVYGKLEDPNLDIGYIYLRECPAGFEEFMFSEWNPYETLFAKKFEKAVLELMDTDGIIIDIRTNDGGRPEPLYRGLAHLIKGKEDIQPFGAAGRDTSKPGKTNLQVIENYPWSAFKADDPDQYYENPIIVMTGPDCISACDMLVALLSKYDEFTIIGKQPNGSATQVAGSMPYQVTEDNKYDVVYTYLTNLTFFFRDDEERKYLMRRDDFLDKPKWFTKDDLGNEVDTIREYAVELIKNEVSPQAK